MLNTNGNRRKIVFIVIILFLVVAVLGVQNNFKSKNQKLEEVRLGVSKAAPELSALVYVAENQNYFKDQWLDVKQIEEENGIIAQQNALKGVTDIATTIDFAFVSDSFDNDALRILATIDRAKFVYITARRDSGINDISDLKGKKIAVVSKSASEFLMGNFLTFHDLTLKDVTLVYLAFGELENAITTGVVDAIATNDPFAYKIKTALGTNGISWSAQDNSSVYWLVVSSEDYIKLHPETTERFLKALVQAEEFIKDNPEDSKRIVKEHLNLEQNYFDQTWAKSDFGVTLEQSLLLAMEQQARWRIANKLTDKTVIPNYIDYIYTDALRKVNLDAVTLY
ncbi:MAG: NrtA/SsuA/CpmA family ABC transporter substrate-binding protein [bacterium]|nr:NrtA/SsuA/CpmA family ABC transporter substrate-binding protein [bacterium]